MNVYITPYFACLDLLMPHTVSGRFQDPMTTKSQRMISNSKLKSKSNQNSWKINYWFCISPISAWLPWVRSYNGGLGRLGFHNIHDYVYSNQI